MIEEHGKSYLHGVLCPMVAQHAPDDACSMLPESLDSTHCVSDWHNGLESHAVTPYETTGVER